MTNIERYVGAESSTGSFLARVPGTAAHARRQQDLDLQRHREADLARVAHEGALEQVRHMYAVADARANVEAAALVSATAVRAARMVGEVADEAYRSGSSVTQAFVLDMAAAIGPELNRVGKSHVAHFSSE